MEAALLIMVTGLFGFKIKVKKIMNMVHTEKHFIFIRE